MKKKIEKKSPGLKIKDLLLDSDLKETDNLRFTKNGYICTEKIIKKPNKDGTYTLHIKHIYFADTIENKKIAYLYLSSRNDE